jgi:glycosyltransferase involved in cell wall biosynthesis
MTPLELSLGLPEPTAFRKFGAHDDGWLDHYGAALAAAEYAGIALPERYTIRGIWTHGCLAPWEAVTPGLVLSNSPRIGEWPAFVTRQEEADYLSRHGIVARAIGSPILYAPEAPAVPRLSRSLLVMPTHTLNGARFPDRQPFRRYADEIKEAARDFSRVVVCLHPNCLRNGLWVDEFKALGFEIVVGANTLDRFALHRMKALLGRFETVTTNGWGSHVAYALAAGAKVSIHGTCPAIPPETFLRLDQAWRKDPESLRKVFSSEVEAQKQEFLRTFLVPPSQAVADPEKGGWLIGARHRLTPEEMKDVLERIILPAASAPAAKPASPAAREDARGDLPVVLVRSHEFNYSETFVEDHVNHLSSNLTLLYGFPFPRFRRGGQSVLPAGTEQKIQAALAAKGTVTAELWAEYSAGLAAFLAQSGARSVLVETGLMGAFVHEACEQASLPFVVHFHGVDAFGRELLERWLPRYRKFFGSAASVLAVSRAMHAQLLQLGADPDRTHLAPYGVAVDLPALAEPAKAPPHFVAVGRFVEKKAPHLTLQAFAAVHRSVPEARLVMIGDGPLLPACRKWAEENGLVAAVTFAGVQSREEVSRRMASSRIFVQHSIVAANGDSEGLPLAVLEAGAHGLPVVATRHAGIPDAVRDGVDGFLVAEKDVGAMAEAMLRLARDAGLAARLGASFRERVVAEYSREVSLTRLRSVMQAAAAGRSAREFSTLAQDAAPVRKPREAIAEDRNNLNAYVEHAAELIDAGEFAGAYLAVAEAHRLCGGTEQTKTALEQLEAHGALSQPQVQTYRRRAGWLPQFKHPAPQRILVVTNLLPPQEMGGYGRTVWEFSRELTARGHTVRVLTADMPHLTRKPTAEHAEFEQQVRRTLKLVGDWKDGSVVVEPDAERRKAILRDNHQTILREIELFKPMAIMAGNLDLVGHFFIQPALDHGIPVLHRLGNAFPGYDPAQAPRGPLFCLAGCSEWVNRGLRAKNYPISRYAVVPPGSPLTEYFRAWSPQRERLRIAYAGLLMPYKGAHVLVTALAYLKRVGVDFECTLAGDTTRPEYLESLRAIAKQYGFLNQLHFPGFMGKRELAGLFARSNVLVFPSVFEEPFGKTQIEAMAAGLLVVSSGSGGASEIIENGKTGLLFKGGDARDLAEKLLSAHRNQRAAEQIALAGQARAFEFTTEASVDRLERIFDELLALAHGVETAPGVATADTAVASCASVA